MKPTYKCEFNAKLFRYSGESSSWVFAVVPKKYAPGVTLGWGRTPVIAAVDAKTWETSVWREKSGRTLLAVPKKIRGKKDDGDNVEITLQYSIEYRSESVDE